jgi:hypothetical protein
MQIYMVKLLKTKKKESSYSMYLEGVQCRSDLMSNMKVSDHNTYIFNLKYKWNIHDIEWNKTMCDCY